ncbi:Cerato-platanin [Russula emetica]|nr:Cerato-platanin [Russula emetica]
MIYFTTFIFTLLLSHIARAVLACGDAASPQELYDTEQPNLATYKVTWDDTYDNPNGNTDSVACSNGQWGLDGAFPQFKDFPIFPYIGGAFDIKWDSPNCGKCWKLTNPQTGRRIYLTAIDAARAARTGFNISKHAFIALNGGTVGSGTLEAKAIVAHDDRCGL